MKQGRKRLWQGLTAVLAGVLFFLLQCAGERNLPILRNLNAGMCDRIYQIPSGTTPVVKIIGIDEETLAAYGKFEQWSRQRLAELAELLGEEENRPAVLGLDLLLMGDGEETTDRRLAEACQRLGTVVTGSNLVYRTAFRTEEDGLRYYDAWNVSMQELPYEALKQVTKQGFTNAVQDKDGIIRRTQLWCDTQEGRLHSFAAAVYLEYERFCGREENAEVPADTATVWFAYSGVPGSYETVSLCDVLDRTVDARGFKNSIVLVGAYAPGTQDAYHVAVQQGRQMYGVEIHANIIQSLQEGKMAVPANTLVCALLGALLFSGYCFLLQVQRLRTLLLEGIALIAGTIVTGAVLIRRGIWIPLFYLSAAVLLALLYAIVMKYAVERHRRKRVLSAFRKYVAPQVVNQLLAQGEFQIRLGGENRQIAVLFVDIRGFTPMSEGLEPEQVVGILNEYLELTSRAIFQNEGTLDKFIGDAAMAVFNAPFSLEDYVFRAICTARDIVQGTEALSRRLTEQYGKTVSFGIGIHCGPAVVGNIGSERRMDYTAIGDTVNTAARLESVAQPGQILLSEAVVEAVRGRIEAEPVGELQLKGKEKKVMTYALRAVDGILLPEAR